MFGIPDCKVRKFFSNYVIKNIFSAVFTFMMTYVYKKQFVAMVGEIMIFHIGCEKCIGTAFYCLFYEE